MSTTGIQLFANALSHLQSIRGELLRMGSKQCATKSGQQDMRLAQLLDVAKDSVKHEFTAITVED